MRIIITGGTGFIGSALSAALENLGHEVIAVVRSLPRYPQKGIGYIQANLIEGEVPPICADCDGIIHLAGAPIFHYWTKSYKQLLFDSRIKTARAIYDFLSKQSKRPQFFISASGVGFYGDRNDEDLIETSGPGTDFLASLCVEWEKTGELFSSLGMRTVSIRTAVVLSKKGGALAKMLPLFRIGLGGKLGNGLQWFPWIHVDDLVSIYVQAILDKRMAGPINAVAPGVIQNIEFTKTLGSLLKRPIILSIPAFFLRLVLGEMATALLSSQRALPSALEKSGFCFAYPEIRDALKQEVCRTGA